MGVLFIPRQSRYTLSQERGSEYMSMLPQKSPQDALAMIDAGALLIDVRERGEIDQVAYDVAEVMVFPLSEAQDRLPELPADRDIVWACRSGNRSNQIGQALYAHGLTRAVNLAGGIIAWAQAGLPIRQAQA